MPRITFIGAGSVVFTRNLVRDVITYPALAGSEIVLMDVDHHRLANIEKLVRRLSEQQGASISVRATDDRLAALRGADYVVFTVAVGGVETWAADIDIAARCGVSQCVGDTLGPGGILRGLRHLPVLDAVLADMAQVCPDALLLQYSNPMSILTWQASQSGLRTVGLCHSVQGTAKMLGEWCGLRPGELNYWAAGINHQAWFLELRRGAEDLYPTLAKVVVDEALRAKEPIRIELFERFGRFVTESSGHASEYYPYFRKNKAMVDQLVEVFRRGGTSSEWLGYGATGGCPEHSRRRADDYERSIAAQLAGEEPIPAGRSEEYGVRIINAIETDEAVEINGNVANAGLIPNLPAGACVEVPCLVRANGVHPCRVGDLPPQLAALNRASISMQEMALIGHRERSTEAIFQAMALDPLTGACCSLDDIWRLGRELLEANRQWLPQF